MRTHNDGQDKEKERNGQSRGQQAEVEEAYASHGFQRISGTSQGRNKPVRNVTRIPED